jgi:hypothetical protein
MAMISTSIVWQRQNHKRSPSPLRCFSVFFFSKTISSFSHKLTNLWVVFHGFSMYYHPQSWQQLTSGFGFISCATLQVRWTFQGHDNLSRQNWWDNKEQWWVNEEIGPQKRQHYGDVLVDLYGLISTKWWFNWGSGYSGIWTDNYEDITTNMPKNVVSILIHEQRWLNFH